MHLKLILVNSGRKLLHLYTIRLSRFAREYRGKSSAVYSKNRFTAAVLL